MAMSSLMIVALAATVLARFGQGGTTRPAFAADLTGSWLPAVPDLHAALRHGPDRRIADVGCGAGWSTIALAQVYPDAQVVGYDLDEASIRDAHRHADEADVDVRFECVDAAALAPGGSLLIAYECVAAEFTAPGDDIERMMYGWSIRLPAGRHGR